MKEYCCPISWTDIATAVGTVGAVIVALFGQFVPKLFPPKLRIKLHNPKGLKQQIGYYVGDGGTAMVLRSTWARYYHVEVTNTRRWARARNVRVVIRKWEVQSGSDAGWVTLWSARSLPLVWQHQDHLGTVRIVGPPALADLVNVQQDISDATRIGLLTVTPTFAPVGVAAKYEPPFNLRLTLQAQSDETDSPLIVVTIRCGAAWQDGETEMAEHVRVEESKP